MKQKKLKNGKKVWVPNKKWMEHARLHVIAELKIKLFKQCESFESDEFLYQLTETDIEQAFFECFSGLRNRKKS